MLSRVVDVDTQWAQLLRGSVSFVGFGECAWLGSWCKVICNFSILLPPGRCQLQKRRNKFHAVIAPRENPRHNNTRNHQPSPKKQNLISLSTVKQASNHEIARIRLHGHGGITLARQRPRRIRSRCKSCTLCNHPTRCPFVFPLTNITPEMRFRPTLPFGASRWNAILVQMRPRGTMHLQWLRRLHAL